MNQQQYIRERRADSIQTMIPAVTAFTMISSLLGIVILSPDLLYYWSLWLNVLATPFIGYHTWKLLEKEQQTSAGVFFVGAYLVLLALTYVDTWTARSVIPFFFAVPVVISSMLVSLMAGFYVWLASAVLIMVGIVVGGTVNGPNIGYLFMAVLLNGLLAGASYLSAMDWKLALESVSELQRRAQDRRDDLFAMKEDLSQINARLNFTNLELDKARAAAVRERDLRTRFMNNVSHELRTPLNAVVNFAHIVSQGGRGAVNEAQADYLGRIEQAGEHVLQILNDLLDMAQIESGEFKLYLEPVDLKAICEEVVTNVRGLVLGTDVQLIRDYPEVWPEVEVDRTRLKQSLINIFGNAAKYTEEGHIALRVRVTEEWVHLHIEDTGVGIDPKYHELIFQEFRQVDETAARRRIGTGLGLPITRHLIERHRGQITVNSSPGKGSTFTVTLPVFRADETVVEEGNVLGGVPAMPVQVAAD